METPAANGLALSWNLVDVGLAERDSDDDESREGRDENDPGVLFDQRHGSILFQGCLFQIRPRATHQPCATTVVN